MFGFQRGVKDTISHHRELDLGEQVDEEIDKQAELKEGGETQSMLVYNKAQVLLYTSSCTAHESRKKNPDEDGELKAL